MNAAAAESGRNPVSKHYRLSLTVESEQADAGRDGTAESATRDQILRREERGQGNIY